MLKKIILLFCFLYFNSIIAEEIKPVLEQQLIKYYANLTKLEANFIQTKEAKFLAKPVISKGKITFTINELIWEIDKPNKQKIALINNQFYINDKEQKISKQLELSIFFIKSIWLQHYDDIRKNFSLEIGEKEIIGNLLKNKKLDFKKLYLLFNDNLLLSKIELTADNEKLIIELSEQKVFK